MTPDIEKIKAALVKAHLYVGNMTASTHDAGIYSDKCWCCEAIVHAERIEAALPAVVEALQRVARLNPDAGTIGPGMLWNIVDASNNALALLEKKS